jgi:hypothetical protein
MDTKPSPPVGEHSDTIAVGPSDTFSTNILSKQASAVAVLWNPILENPSCEKSSVYSLSSRLLSKMP